MFNLRIICTQKRDILYGLCEETSCIVCKEEFNTMLTIERITTFEKCCTYFNNYLMEMDKLFMKRRKFTFLRLKNVLNEQKAEMIYEQMLSWFDTGEYLRRFLKIMSMKDKRTIIRLNNGRMKIIVDIMYRMTKRLRYLTVSVNSLLDIRQLAITTKDI
ncbi:hypothetical protein THOM_0885 [Trachipleistophora hominis]|uniref:Uncharacterized protein n=1 Tax=Trachipleistophora hominis TaxID=72359 RepID=L7JYP6_TRAHO|nr:hypothetical protein THOM_0885 [Trachipleistophora hominis]